MRQKQLCFEDDPQPRAAHTKTAVRSDEHVSSTHKTKVLAIMDYRIFKKQAYRGTGSQKDSRLGVTDSIHGGLNHS